MTLIAPTLQAFFTDRLTRQLHASPRTLASYRDSLRLLLCFANDRTGIAPSALDWDDLDEPPIAAFLDHLERDRHNSAHQLDDPRLAPAHLDAWLAWASRSRPAPFIRLARTIRRHRAGILAAIRLGLTNGPFEGLNSRIRLISHRSFGFHSAAPLIALVYLCRTGIVIDLPQ